MIKPVAENRTEYCQYTFAHMCQGQGYQRFGLVLSPYHGPYIFYACVWLWLNGLYRQFWHLQNVTLCSNRIKLIIVRPTQSHTDRNSPDRLSFSTRSTIKSTTVRNNTPLDVSSARTCSRSCSVLARLNSKIITNILQIISLSISLYKQKITLDRFVWHK